MEGSAGLQNLPQLNFLKEIDFVQQSIAFVVVDVTVVVVLFYFVFSVCLLLCLVLILLFLKGPCLRYGVVLFDI